MALLSLTALTPGRADTPLSPSATPTTSPSATPTPVPLLPLPTSPATTAPPATTASPLSAPPPFYLHDGDTVVFYGDSITEQQGYTRDIETWVLTRFPSWHVKFINFGWNGDRVTGGKGGTADVRLKRDVIPYHPTVVTVLLGMNDAAYTHFDAGAYTTYTQGMTHIVDILQQSLPNARLTLLTPTFYDDEAPLARARGLHTYNNVLKKYGDFVSVLAARRGLTVVDLNTPLREATIKGRQTNPKFTMLLDGIHPDEAGQLIMAAAMLQAWHAPTTATLVTLNPTAPVAVTLPLPWPLPDSARPAFAVSSMPGRLNIFQVNARDLPTGNFVLSADGQPIGTLKSQDLAAGINLTHLPALPENHQSALVLKHVQDRLDTWRYLWKGSPEAVARPDDTPTDAEIAALKAIDDWLDTQRTLVHTASQPQPTTFTLRPSTATAYAMPPPTKFATLPKSPSVFLPSPSPRHTFPARQPYGRHSFRHTRGRYFFTPKRSAGRGYSYPAKV